MNGKPNTPRKPTELESESPSTGTRKNSLCHCSYGNMSVGTRKNSLCHWKNSLCPWERGRTRKNPWERGRTYVNVGAASEHQFVRRHLIFIPPSTLEIDEDIPPPISSLTNFPLDHIMHPCVILHDHTTSVLNISMFTQEHKM